MGAASALLVSRMHPAAGLANPPKTEPRPPDTKAEPPKPPVIAKQQITFKIREARAKKVQIMGDFTDWKPVDLTPGNDKVWTYSLSLPAGEYRYNFLVDDSHAIKDPNNPKATSDGNNSILNVKTP